MKYKILQIFDIYDKIIYSHVVRGRGQFISCILTLAQFEDTSWIYKPLPYNLYSFYIMWGPCKSDFRVRRSPTFGASLYTDCLPSSSRRPDCFCGLVSSYCCLNCSQRAANLCPATRKRFHWHSGRRGSVDVSQCQVAGTGHRVAAVTWLLSDDPGQTGQQNQCCSQEEAEEGGGERGSSPAAAAGGHTGNTAGEGGGVSVWFTCPGSLKELSANR